MENKNNIFKENLGKLPLDFRYLRITEKKEIAYTNRYIKVKRYQTNNSEILPFYKKTSLIIK